jgi:hypothetical protein
MAVPYLEVRYRCPRPLWPMRHALMPLTARQTSDFGAKLGDHFVTGAVGGPIGASVPT